MGRATSKCNEAKSKMKQVVVICCTRRYQLDYEWIRMQLSSICISLSLNRVSSEASCVCIRSLFSQHINKLFPLGVIPLSLPKSRLTVTYTD